MEQTKYYLAVDIGASSGRHILAHMENGHICLEEIYRFPNGMEEIDGHLCWNTETLYGHILEGMKQCKAAGKIPESMGIDTWAVDYVLLDTDGKQLGNCIAYRDGRTQGMDQLVYETISEKELYRKTGIQKAIFNTIYQLMACKQNQPEILEQAEHLLMIPDYFHYRLTGVMKQEYTNATTTQLINPLTRDWDYELIRSLGYPEKLFGSLSLPGTQVGMLQEEVARQVGFSCRVVLPATHDTASAVMSVPCVKQDCLYISSGTWSLMGCELQEPNCSPEAQTANFTNEGGYEYRYRFLKNIMGLWMIQSVKKELEAGWEPECGTEQDQDYSFAHLCDRAAKEAITSWVDANDSRFLAPKSMIAEVQEACRNNGMQVPQTAWELAAVIYHSLARCYAQAAGEIEALTGKHFSAIHIVGGGSNADYLNRLTARDTGRSVIAGPGEATAIGNLGAQMIADGVFAGLQEFRSCVADSFDVKEYR